MLLPELCFAVGPAAEAVADRAAGRVAVAVRVACASTDDGLAAAGGAVPLLLDAVVVDRGCGAEDTAVAASAADGGGVVMGDATVVVRL